MRERHSEPRVSVLEARGLSRRFGDRTVLRDVSLKLGPSDIHALLGPNGAGKTTLLRIVAGLLLPSEGVIRAMGVDVRAGTRDLRQRLGLIPAGDRSFYLRLSGLENLLFFGRLHGLRKKAALARAYEVLEEVDLAEHARVPVGVYSHGMQKRLSVARALLMRPALLLVDEATHDLDPTAARNTRDLVRGLAEHGTAVLWATQRLDEIRGFANGVTLIDRGTVRFQGSVPDLMAHAVPRHYLVRVRNGKPRGMDLRPALEASLSGMAAVVGVEETDNEHYRITLGEGVILGDAMATLAAAQIHVLACREERSEIEEAFLSLTGKEAK